MMSGICEDPDFFEMAQAEIQQMMMNADVTLTQLGFDLDKEYRNTDLDDVFNPFDDETTNKNQLRLSDESNSSKTPREKTNDDSQVVDNEDICLSFPELDHDSYQERASEKAASANYQLEEIK